MNTTIRAPLLAVLPIVGLVAACGTTAEPEPEVITETVTETVTETIEVTPPVCVEALDLAERITHENTIPAFDAMSDAMYAAAAFDAAGINAATETIEQLTGEAKGLIDDYNLASAACRALAEG